MSEKELKDTIVSLKETVNYLLDKDRERIAWRNLVEQYYDDADTFMEVKIDIENGGIASNHYNLK